MNNDIIPLNDLELDYCTPPGATIEEAMETLCMSKESLAALSGIEVGQITRILKGSCPISRDMACGLERATGIPSTFLLRMEEEYRNFLKKQRPRRREKAGAVLQGK